MAYLNLPWALPRNMGVAGLRQPAAILHVIIQARPVFDGWGSTEGVRQGRGQTARGL